MSKSVEALAERKFKITGRIHKVEGVQPKKTGFSQRIMLHIPELKDDMTDRVIRREQYYWVELYSTNQTDSRFVASSRIKELVCCAVYLNSYHWVDKDGLNTVPRLSFIEWLKIEN